MFERACSAIKDYEALDIIGCNDIQGNPRDTDADKDAAGCQCKVPEQTLIATGDYLTGSGALTYDVETNDQGFLMMGLRQLDNTELIVVDDWFAELEGAR
ncbi:MAG: hypothetical protein ACJAVI_005290 [Candidatus Azotimanducaceae bacterium]|jgi:hypothetical protein